MLLVHNLDHINPSVNLAIEEYCLNKYGKQNELFMLYTNDNAVIVGKNQNVWEEINTVYTAANNIPIIRRISGGGTVFHDLGNLVFSFIVPYDRKNVLNFGNFYNPFAMPSTAWACRHTLTHATIFTSTISKFREMRSTMEGVEL